MDTMVFALNTISGQIANVSLKMLEHPTFKDILIEVDADAKPYVAELYTSGSKQEKYGTIKVDFGNTPVVEDKAIKTSTDNEEEI